MAEGGNDRVSYRNADGAVTIDLSTATFGGAAAGDAFNGIGGVIGTAFADTFQGDAFSNFFQTGGGDDVADGGDGVNILSFLGSALDSEGGIFYDGRNGTVTGLADTVTFSNFEGYEGDGGG